MAIYYHKSYSKIHGTRNFGDDINPRLLEAVFHPSIVSSADICIVGIGTILNDRELQRVDHFARKIVFSSGVGYGRLNRERFDASWDIACVRGRLSASALGLPESVAVCDGAVLLADIIEQPMTARREQVTFIPHINSHRSVGELLREMCAIESVGYLPPDIDADVFFRTVGESRLVIAEAMHGAIVADALRTPWIPASFMEHDAFKWMDWCSSVGLDYQCSRLAPAFWPAKEGASSAVHIARAAISRVKQAIVRVRLRRLAQSTTGNLSHPEVLERHKRRLWGIAARINEFYASP